MEDEVTISKFKATCLALLAKVKRTGRPILVTRKGEPIAQIIPPPPPKRPESWLGSLSKTGKIIGDIVSPAVPEHEWEASRRWRCSLTRTSFSRACLSLPGHPHAD